MSNWNLTHLFKTNEDWEKTFQSLKDSIPKLKSYEGKLKKFNSFLEYYKIFIPLNKDLEHVFMYAMLASDLDKKNTENDSRFKKVYMLISELTSATSWVSPEILKIGEKKIMSFIKKDEYLEQLDFSMEKLFRSQEHVLSADKEALLSNFSNFANTPASTYSALAINDKVHEEVELSTGEKVKITNANFPIYLEKKYNVSDRKKVVEALYKGYKGNKATFANIYNAILQKNWAFAKAKNFNSCLEANLFSKNIPISVYTNLCEVIKGNNKSVIKYQDLIVKHFGLEKFGVYNNFLSVGEDERAFTYEEGKEIFFKSIDHFSDDFKAKAKKVLEDGFVDVEEKDGKRTGAYSMSVTDSPCYILLNYTGKGRDVSTLAHEAGHSMHSLYSKETQKAMKQSYEIFVAEIASTFNEHALLDYRLKNAKSATEKASLLQTAIKGLLGTVHRQTAFAEYEYEIHKLVEQGVPINHEVLTEKMNEINKGYFGVDLTEDNIGAEYMWAYIPHLFQSPFYVYQYATSFSASLKIYEDVKNNVAGAMDKYIELLSAGGSKYPIDIVKDAGVDLTKKEPFLAVVKRLDELVEMFEKTLEEI